MIPQARHLDDIAPTRWKNGLGTTRELLRVGAPDGDGFAWRVSVATVECDAAFSRYTGIDRTLAILHGAGMRLIDATTGQPWKTLRQPLESLTFTGERALEGRLIDGPVLDFNVMTRRDIARAELRVVGPSRMVCAPACRLLFVARGSVRVDRADGSRSTLGAFEFIATTDAIRFETSPDSAALAVELFKLRALTANTFA